MPTLPIIVVGNAHPSIQSDPNYKKSEIESGNRFKSREAKVTSNLFKQLSLRPPGSNDYN
jgi:hypothetical protein